MRRLASWMLAICFVLLGSGTVHHWHHLQPIEHYACGAGDHDHHAPPSAPADHSDCQLCILLRQPVHVDGALALPHFFTEPTSLVDDAAPTCAPLLRSKRIACRGPPARSSSL